MAILNKKQQLTDCLNVLPDCIRSFCSGSRPTEVLTTKLFLVVRFTNSSFLRV